MANITHLNFFAIFLSILEKNVVLLLKIWYKFFINTYYEQIKNPKK